MKIAIISNIEKTNDVFKPKALERLGELGELVINQGDASIENVKATIKDADIAITSWGNEAITEEILNECPNLKFLMHAAGSVKRLSTDALWARGIRMASSTKPLGIGVAETALGQTIAACKNFYAINDDLHNGGYYRDNIKEVYEITVGVIGAGAAGGHYIKLMNNFGVEILLYDPYVSDERAAEMGCKKAELKELLEKSDVISIHAPRIPETDHMINAETLKLMKKDAVLINTARGTIIDEQALYEHMAAGNLKYACLDVYDPEPPAADSPLRSLKNIILTSHIAGLVTNGLLRVGDFAVTQVERFIAGEPIEGEVFEDMIARMT